MIYLYGAIVALVLAIVLTIKENSEVKGTPMIAFMTLFSWVGVALLIWTQIPSKKGK